jgi:hypothetical protein
MRPELYVAVKEQADSYKIGWKCQHVVGGTLVIDILLNPHGAHVIKYTISSCEVTTVLPTENSLCIIRWDIMTNIALNKPAVTGDNKTLLADHLQKAVTKNR